MLYIIQTIFFLLLILFTCFCIGVFADMDNLATYSLLIAVFIMATIIVFGFIFFILSLL